ncbi:hypothetical protein MKX03_035818 [Papaver bracteatum]|nr:hypothetical protein MKX03_035818 [Papaver bracteatum]
MGSQDSFNGCEQPGAHKPCAKRCGYFGTAANLDMCSKCYREYLKEEEQSLLVKAAFEKSAKPKKALTTSPKESIANYCIDDSNVAAKETTMASSSYASSSATSGGESGAVAKNRCCSCNKKVGLTGIKCKCGSVFCSMHRYPEKHSCIFDYKAAGKERIAKLNPQVKMGSQDSFSGCEQPGAHKPCAKRCGFFGSAANLGMCSKCYRDHIKEEEQSLSAKAAFEKSANPKKALITSPKESGVDYSTADSNVAAKESTTASASSAATSGGESGAVAKNRCFSCNKKVGLTGIKCRCGSVFCSMHRYPEKHSCDFDYKAAGKETIAKLNPHVKADKIERF